MVKVFSTDTYEPPQCSRDVGQLGTGVVLVCISMHTLHVLSGKEYVLEAVYVYDIHKPC